MADEHVEPPFVASWEPIEEADPLRDQPSPSAMTTPAWPLYDGRRELVHHGGPEPVSDGVPPPIPTPWLRRFWPWVVADALGAVVVVGAAVVLISATTVTPDTPEPESHQVGAVAPARWAQVDPSLTAGLVIVQGGAEADGIVLASTGLVATSYARLMGDSRPRGEGLIRIVADGQAVEATMVGSEVDADIAFVQSPGFVPQSVAIPGTPVRVGETLTLLDVQGGTLPVVGVGVRVTDTDSVCSRAGSTARPRGFRFSLDVASAEPGAALVRADGTVVGMYYGGNDATHHCAIPISDVMEALPAR